MSWWKRSSRSETKREERAMSDAAAQKEALALDAQAELLAKRDETLADTLAEHAADVAAYKFTCRRWGDFLTMEIERPSRIKERHEWMPRTHEAVSVHLTEASVITINPGRGPDEGAVVRYIVQDDYDFVTKQQVRRAYPHADMIRDPWRRILAIDDRDGGDAQGHYHPRSDIYARIETPNQPRYAKDDEIYFGGSRVRLFIPAGLGEEIYGRIMRGIAKRRR